MVLQSLVAGLPAPRQHALTAFFGRDRWHQKPKSFGQRLENVHEVFRAASAAFPELPPLPSPAQQDPYQVSHAFSLGAACGWLAALLLFSDFVCPPPSRSVSRRSTNALCARGHVFST